MIGQRHHHEHEQPLGDARLEAHLNEGAGLGIKRSRINEILLAEGLRWHQQETWFGERVDPDFARKRGRSKPSTAPRPQAAS